jgi:hypothetical protein
MNKVAHLMKFDNSEIEDLRSFLHQHNDDVSKSYNQVLNNVIEQALGRPFNVETDASRIYANSYQGTNQTDYYLDGKLLGTLSTIMSYDGNDFVNNKVSFVIQFTPNIQKPL